MGDTIGARPHDIVIGREIEIDSQMRRHIVGMPAHRWLEQKAVDVFPLQPRILDGVFRRLERQAHCRPARQRSLFPRVSNPYDRCFVFHVDQFQVFTP